MSSKKYRNKTCVYCRDARSSTADHVFPREIFQKHQRVRLPKVPACADCNNKKSRLEHYILTVLPFGATHSHAKKVLSKDVARRLSRNHKLHREVNRGFKYGYFPYQGHILERGLSVKFDGNILHEYIGLVGLGLMWHHWKKILDANYIYVAFTPSPTGMEFIDGLFRFRTPHRVNITLGGDTVRYKGVMSEKGDGISIWAVQLFGGITIATGNRGHILKNSFVVMMSGPPNVINDLNIDEGMANKKSPIIRMENLPQ